MTRKRIAILILGFILIASLLACGYFCAKTVRRSYQRRTAMAAYEKKEYKEAERLLQRYLQKDPNSEPEIVALANIYHEFGNTGMEARMWLMASSLNPLNGEYRKNMLETAAKSASYGLMYSALGRRINMSEKMDDTELSLFVISAFRVGHAKEGKEVFKKKSDADRDTFQKNDLGRFAEFLVTSDKSSPEEQLIYLKKAEQSEDPTVRFQALYSRLLHTINQAEDEEIEGILKQLQEINYFAGTPILANYLFSRCRFDDFLSEAEPYLNKIDDNSMYILYAETCVLTDKWDKLKELQKLLQGKTGALQTIADYCEILIAYLENDEAKLCEETRKSAKLFSSPVFRFIRLRVAMSQGSYSEILAAANELFSNETYYDLFDRAMVICLDYLTRQMLKPENQNDPSKMAELARILSGYRKDDRLIFCVILADQYKKGLAKDTDLLDALDKYPNDPLLLRIASEYMVFHNKPEQALPLIEELLNIETENYTQPTDRVLFLQMVALDQTGKHNEAAEIFRTLVSRSEFDVGWLAEYFRFCCEYKRTDDLISMADRLDTVEEGKLKQYSAFFRAASLILSEDEAKRTEALNMLAATPEDNPMFTFYAANELSEADRLDEAEKKYKAILDTYPIPLLVHVNLSELYKAKGDAEKALASAKKGFEVGQSSWLPAYIYARRLSEAGRYEEAVEVLNLPRRADNYRQEVVDLWTTCMKMVIEKNIATEKYMQAEDQCKHLLIIVPDDDFAREKLEMVREILFPKKDKDQNK